MVIDAVGDMMLTTCVLCCLLAYAHSVHYPEEADRRPSMSPHHGHASHAQAAHHGGEASSHSSASHGPTAAPAEGGAPVPTPVSPTGGDGQRRASVAAHNRRGSVVPVNVDRAALNYQRRKSVDVPVLPQGSLPKLAGGLPEDPSQAQEGGAPAVASPSHGQHRPSQSSAVAGGGEPQGLERKGSVRQVLQAAQAEACK